jgi:hypothetical protein
MTNAFLCFAFQQYRVQVPSNMGQADVSASRRRRRSERATGMGVLYPLVTLRLDFTRARFALRAP